MEIAPRIGTHHVTAHSYAATAEQATNVEGPRINIHTQPIPATDPAEIDLGHVTPPAVAGPPGSPRAAPLPPSFGDKALFDMYMWLRDTNQAWDYRQVMEEANTMLGRRVSNRDNPDSSGLDEAKGIILLGSRAIRDALL